MINKPFLGLRTVIYKVANLDAAKDWYTQAFETKPYFDEPYHVGFTIGGYELGLQPGDDAKGSNVATYWGTNNVEEQYKRLLNMGATPHEEPQNVGGDIVVGAVKDPWDNVLGLIYNPEFKAE